MRGIANLRRSTHGGAPALAVTLACLALAGCSSSDRLSRKVDPKYGVAASPRVVEFGETVPKGGGVYRVGKPYMVAGREYVPEEDINYRVEGMASHYGNAFHGRLTANGEVFDMGAISAAHPTLPMPSYVRVTNLANRRSIVVRVNDRGPFHSDRIIDLSTRTADLLGFRSNGVARVRVEYVGRAAIEGSDDRKLMATLRHGDPAPHPSSLQLASASAGVVPATRQQPIRGHIPVPAGRPFSLGDTQPDDPAAAQHLTAAPPPSLIARDERRRVGPANAMASAAPVSPVTAFAPVTPPSAHANMTAGFLSGRGLY